MGKNELKGRKIWQDINEIKASNAEQNLYKVFEKHFKDTIYCLHRKPKHLNNLYENVKLRDEVLSQIYNPSIEDKKWGVSPDFAIENTQTNKILFGEIKRQDGWVEDKLPSAGRGNAHERLCKLFTPGLLKKYRELSHIENDDFLPFWVVFQGDITRDPKRVREITFWFDEYQNNFFMWRPNDDENTIINFFEKIIKKYLD